MVRREAVARSEPHARVLLCEGEKSTAEGLEKLLRTRGHEVLVCHDGPSSISQAKKWRPTAAVIDIALPGITGYAVAQHLRGLFGSDVLLIAITAHDAPADIEMARYAGFNWHFASTARLSHILDVLDNPKRKPRGRRDGVRLNS